MISIKDDVNINVQIYITKIFFVRIVPIINDPYFTYTALMTKDINKSFTQNQITA